MKYPYRVIFIKGGKDVTFVVDANDSRKAVRKAARQWGRPLDSWDSVFVRSLTPKKVGDHFLPRVGSWIIGSPTNSYDGAVDYALKHSYKIMMERCGGRNE